MASASYVALELEMRPRPHLKANSIRSAYSFSRMMEMLSQQRAWQLTQVPAATRSFYSWKTFPSVCSSPFTPRPARFRSVVYHCTLSYVLLDSFCSLFSLFLSPPLLTLHIKMHLGFGAPSLSRIVAAASIIFSRYEQGGPLCDE
jgi:hypothetical protein